MARADDLSTVLRSSGSVSMEYRQGTVQTWDVTTGSNTVSIGGVVHDDLPVLGRIAAMSIVAGDIVGIGKWRDQYFVLGLVADPATQADVTIRQGTLTIDGGRVVLQGGDDLVVRDGGDIVVQGGGNIQVQGGGNVNINGNLSVDGDATLGSRLTVEGGIVDIQDSGVLIARDNGNVVQARMGELLSNPGEYGFEQRVGGQLVPLAALAGGADVDRVGGTGTLSASSGNTPGYTGSLSGSVSGPVVSFHTYTGRWMILLVAEAGVSTETAGRMSYEASGASSFGPSDSRSALVTDPGTAMGMTQSVIHANVHHQSPGNVTVAARYKVIPPPSSPPANGVASWQNRVMIIFPF
ncbi:hypothetical protein CLV30_1383 [Haloactinopolyspora alba]|uniref:Uncharacterized protein n=1 Tax=Haloactinopolyspora alba TaxID=648780 RepID=A0A2P8D017_9ACTN|nr:hypothetical protein [Haloactinopolyspora alba]PSK90578.1 hypothetical protein CLV30_1383 [Haloactinopolyspora alba]